MATRNKALDAVREGMGKAGGLSYPKVARLAGLDVRTVRCVDERSSIGTLEKIAKALGGKLVISVAYPPDHGLSEALRAEGYVCTEGNPDGSEIWDLPDQEDEDGKEYVVRTVRISGVRS